MTYSELDDLKSAWQSLNRTLEKQHAFALHLFRENKMTHLRSGFRPLVIGQTIQLISGLLLSLFAGSYWFDHRGVTHLMACGLSLHAYGILLIVFAGRELFLIKRLDYAAPVLVLQKQVTYLRNWHLRAAAWFGVAGCFIWIPLLLAIFYGLGADVWRRSPGVVGWFFVSGVICLGIFCAIVAWSRRSGEKASDLDASCAGRSVARAHALLEEIKRFEEC